MICLEIYHKDTKEVKPELTRDVSNKTTSACRRIGAGVICYHKLDCSWTFRIVSKD